ncbi:Cytochrome c-type biogenesis protein CcmE [Geoglobus ahangari]|uniref:Cytochrome c-type biogenesis protein CcmE n=1 Tax=Geoglobus ahangari TaxID=113653 RepID=A0A0F7DBA5_9EURY|nr:cytochrome c maturation protein CcmE [Geoglobus ahangari]AKG90751.1 Cytochrome c-type biogenesis protein CcmE [Geoglobus ahangari]NOY12084.1 cytochrome c maturation protein CcmE [Archaeoglobi archaeon]
MDKSGKIKLLIGVSLIAFSILVIVSFNQGISPYLTVTQVMEKGYAENVQVNGTIVPNSTVYFFENNTRVFKLTDGKNTIVVKYTGAVSNYQEGIPAVVKGDYRDGVFYAEELLLKCPSKYQVGENKEVS